MDTPSRARSDHPGPRPPEDVTQVFVESQCGRDDGRFVATAAAVGRADRTVLLLIDDGVGQLRRPGIGELDCLVWADEFSLRRRAAAPVPAGVTPVAIDTVAALLLRPGVRAVWH